MNREEIDGWALFVKLLIAAPFAALMLQSLWECMCGDEDQT